MSIKVTIWNENRHEKSEERVREVYPLAIHGTIAEFLEKNDDMIVRTATLDDTEQGLSDELLKDIDVLIWWSHMAHREVSDALVEKIRDRVWTDGMGFIALHSSHMSKPFRSIVGTSGQLSWGDGQREIVWNIMPNHPIAAGIPEYFEITREELYSEPFRVPIPDELVFASWYVGGSIFRSGICYNRGIGRIFYFRPGHETCPSFHNPHVQRIITNAVRWAKPNELTVPIPAGCPRRYNPLVEVEHGGIMER